MIWFLVLNDCFTVQNINIDILQVPGNCFFPCRNVVSYDSLNNGGMSMRDTLAAHDTEPDTLSSLHNTTPIDTSPAAQQSSYFSLLAQNTNE